AVMTTPASHTTCPQISGRFSTPTSHFERGDATRCMGSMECPESRNCAVDLAELRPRRTFSGSRHGVGDLQRAIGFRWRRMIGRGGTRRATMLNPARAKVEA